MKIRSVAAVTVAVIGLSASSAVYAASSTRSVPVHAMFAKSRMVKLNLRNDSTLPLEIKVGQEPMTIEAGKTVALKLAAGTRITANATTPTHQTGTLLAEVTTDLNDATLGIK